MSRSRWQEPNLARAPFVNERPVRRLAVTLWLLFVIIGGLGAWQSVASRQATGARLGELVRLNTETVAARERSATLERELRSADLPSQNERTEFLNRRLAERAFSWSRLLESVTQVMPRGVRLVRLSPEAFASEKRRGGATAKAAPTTRVQMRITGEAEETEAMLEFVDRLFEHPGFDRPNLSRESEKKDTRIQFELAVAYLPEIASEPPTAAAGAGSAATLGSPVGRQPGVGTQTAAASAAAARTAGSALGSAAAATAAAAPPPASGRVPATGRASSTARSGGGVSAWGRGAGAPGDEDSAADADGRGAALPPEAVPAKGGLPGGGLRPGTGGSPGAAPAAGSGAPFPANVMPTPLRPYASTTGGGR